ncbi:MAG: hypothetical protein IPI46_02890 [Bacteroidetes bacterium]|nr:hypothetical protein [Bacteroidota bacterium]
MRIRILLFSILSLILFSVEAQQRKYVNDYLYIGVGARGTGMSGAQVASVNDVTAAYWNPAGLSYIQSDFQLGYMHSEYFSSIAKYDYLGAAFPMKNKKGVLAFSLIRYAIDDIPYTINLIQPDGSVDYSKIKAISAQDYAGFISYAQKVNIKKFAHREDIDIRVGGNLKIISRTIGSMANAWGGGIDLAAQAKVGKWKFGAVLKDATTTYTVWSFSFTEKEKQVFAQTGNEIVSRSSEVATPRLILGGGKNFSVNKKINVLAEVNMDITTDGKRYGNLINLKPFSIDPRLGIELGYNQLFYLRGGIGNFQRILDDKDTNNVEKVTLFQPTFGLGVKLKSFCIDYAFSSLNLQSNPLYSHFISFKIDINKKGYTESAADAKLEQKADQINKSANRDKK